MVSQASPRARTGDDAARVLASIRRLVRFLRLAASDAEARTGISAAQLFVLERLVDAPASSMSELAARTLTDPSSVSTVVSRLVERGLVARTRAATDARRFEIAITARGRAIVRRSPPLAQVRLIRAIESLPARTRKDFASSLEHLVTATGGDSLAPRMFFEDEDAPKKRSRGRA
ncbi:MarR family winged helix-turn-helix transcriptional regulator [Sandaracinus amylolyticus]|uniref:MarR family winged helix-turn-helix transcriptional regulator n=1 Tax=Sandaracinus amylolyticus TaxID=927083 RepID=UPI001F3A7A0F|nr:MarR family winged helix-turn-helix transcriptional regulator [Sandaracinus amylolyticus]UJR86073.1 Hypothetical protein I5071_81540 [Sandaracinus amylolyticus]